VNAREAALNKATGEAQVLLCRIYASGNLLITVRFKKKGKKFNEV
jgi:hypothetical protein